MSHQYTFRCDGNEKNTNELVCHQKLIVVTIVLKNEF